MLGLAFTVDPADVPEAPHPDEGPEAYVVRLAAEKATVVCRRNPDALVLAGDTVVTVEDSLLEKPETEEQAVEMLLALAGRWHLVLTGLAIAGPGGQRLSRVDRARVEFRSFDEDEARAYVATGEPMDKAGGYGIQSKGAALVSRVEGDFYTVMGLSVHGLVSLLDECGWEYRFGRLVATTADQALS